VRRENEEYDNEILGILQVVKVFVNLEFVIRHRRNDAILIEKPSQKILNLSSVVKTQMKISHVQARRMVPSSWSTTTNF
jgi:hypothetical protein